MKVAIVYPVFAHYRKAINEELSAHSIHEVVFVCDDRDVTNSGIPLWSPPLDASVTAARCYRIGGNLLLQVGLARVALRCDVGAIIYLGNPYYVSTWISALIARATGKRVLFWTHGWTRDEHGLKDWVRRLFYRLAHGLLLYGHNARRIGVERGFSEDSLYVVYNSLDYKAIKEARDGVLTHEAQLARAQLFAKPRCPVIICSCRILRERRIDLVLEAMRLLRNEGVLVNFLVVGSGPAEDELKQMAKDLCLPVCFWGQSYDESALARLYAMSDLTVIPDKAGLTVIQSLAYGVPVLAHDDWESQGPEWEAIVPGKTGLYFASGDVLGLSRAIKDWFDRVDDQSEVSRACHEVVERHYNVEYQRLVIDAAVSGLSAAMISEDGEESPYSRSMRCC